MTLYKLVGNLHKSKSHRFKLKLKNMEMNCSNNYFEFLDLGDMALADQEFSLLVLPWEYFQHINAANAPQL